MSYKMLEGLYDVRLLEIEFLILIGVWVNATVNIVFYAGKWKNGKKE